MSIASAIIIRMLRLSNMRSKLANGAQKTYEEAVSYNEKHPFVMPKDKKAVYEKIIIKTRFGEYPCLKISQKDSAANRAVLFTWGGGGLLNTWKSQLGSAVKLGRDAGVPVYYPIYPLATEHSLMDTMEMIAETYRMMTKNCDPDNIAVIGVSSGGSQALNLITYINEYAPGLNKPGTVLCVSPGCVPFTEEEKERMEALEAGDAMVSADFVYSFEKISGFWGKYPDRVQHPTVGNYTGLKNIRF
ncbi:MAG: alpha/beta hydrolase fold domain-containing protein, partial [Clostridia bacterium]|nr:alpha/beta hydrolase fold domain-containing protein [Clostridia bacterium]